MGNWKVQKKWQLDKYASYAFLIFSGIEAIKDDLLQIDQKATAFFNDPSKKDLRFKN